MHALYLHSCVYFPYIAGANPLPHFVASDLFHSYRICPYSITKNWNKTTIFWQPPWCLYLHLKHSQFPHPNVKRTENLFSQWLQHHFIYSQQPLRLPQFKIESKKKIKVLPQVGEKILKLSFLVCSFLNLSISQTYFSSTSFC